MQEIILLLKQRRLMIAQTRDKTKKNIEDAKDKIKNLEQLVELNDKEVDTLDEAIRKLEVD